MSEFGATANGGVERQAASVPDGQQRQWLTGLLEARGFTVKFDRAGNQWGLYEAVPGAPFVVVGSHMDSQPTAGRYDGAYGVLAAAHAAFRLVEQWAAAGPAGQPRFNIAVVNWFNEEGSRFKPSMMGSSVYTGKLELETALATTDAAGVSVRDALDAIGCRGELRRPRSRLLRRDPHRAGPEHGARRRHHRPGELQLGGQQIRVRGPRRAGPHGLHRDRGPERRAAGRLHDGGRRPGTRRHLPRRAAHLRGAADRLPELAGRGAVPGEPAPGPAQRR